MENTNLLTKLGIPMPWEDNLPTIPEIQLSPNYRIGDTIMNRYEVKELLKGSMGDVYHCHDLRRDTDVALKTVISTGKLDHSQMISFSNEINRLLNLPAHPNVVTLQRVELIDGYSFLVTEWVSGSLGSTLADWQKNHSISCADILEFMQQISCGLIHCRKHLSVPGQPYVFGDIKPDNIFVTWNRVFKLGDFSSGHTEGWCAPELVNGHVGDERSDIYGLGIVANKMINSVNDYGSELFDCLDDIFLRCIAYEPEDRFESLRSLQEALGDLCTKFGLEQYKAKYNDGPFKDEYNRRISALNLGLISKVHDPAKDYESLVHRWRVGHFESIHDFLESTSPIEKMMYTAKVNYLSGKLDEALSCLKAPVTSPELLHLKASILYSKGNIEECIHCLLSSILVEDHLPSFDFIASIFLDFPVYAANYRYEIDSIQERLQRLKKERLTGYLPYQAMAKFYMIKKDFKMASSYFRRSLQFLNPEADWQTLYYYGWCEASAGHANNAKIIFNRTISLIQSDPNYRQGSYKSSILFQCLVYLENVAAVEDLADHLKRAFGFDFSNQVEALKQRMSAAFNHDAVSSDQTV